MHFLDFGWCFLQKPSCLSRAISPNQGAAAAFHSNDTAKPPDQTFTDSSSKHNQSEQTYPFFPLPFLIHSCWFNPCSALTEFIPHVSAALHLPRVWVRHKEPRSPSHSCCCYLASSRVCAKYCLQLLCSTQPASSLFSSFLLLLFSSLSFSPFKQLCFWSFPGENLKLERAS